MRKYIFGSLFAVAIAATIATNADVLGAINVFMPFQGGTGTSTKPTTGQVLVGQSNGTYAPQATSTLGIGGLSGGVVNALTYWTSDTAVGATTSPTVGYITATTTTASILPYASTTAVSATTFYGNLTGTSTGNLISGGTLTSNYHCRWDGTGIDCDRVEDASGACAANSVCMGGHIHFGVDEVYASGWNADTDTPEKDDVYDWGHLFDTDDDGKVNVVDTNTGFLVSSDTGVVSATSGPTVNYIVATSTAVSSAFPLLSVTNTLQIPSGAAVYTNSTGSMAIDTTTGQLRWNTGSATSTTVAYYTTGFSFATSTAWTGTTTIYLAPAMGAQTWNTAKCETDAGTVNVSIYDGTNRMNMFTASTTIGAVTLSTNNAFTDSESIRVDVGTPASTPTKIACRFKFTYDAD